METLFLLKDPATLKRFGLLSHASEMMQIIDLHLMQQQISHGIKLTVTAFCEPKVQADNKSLWKTLRFSVRLLKKHRRTKHDVSISSTHVNLWLTVDETSCTTTAAYGNGITEIYEKQTHSEALDKIAGSVLVTLDKGPSFR